MLLDIRSNSVRVLREVTDPKFGKDESWFFYRLSKALKAKGIDCIKKLAYKDGHLVDDNQYYVRDRNGRWMLYDNAHAIRCVSSEFDSTGEVVLTLASEESCALL